MEKLERSQWEIQFIETLKKTPKKNSKNVTLLDLYDNQNRTPFQDRLLKNILDGEYKTYSAKFDFDQSKKMADDKYAKALEAMRKEKQKATAQSRKQRAHELITIGALTEITHFEKDRGLIAGVLLDALERFNVDENLKRLLKNRGDELLHEIELKNKKSKEGE